MVSVSGTGSISSTVSVTFSGIAAACRSYKKAFVGDSGVVGDVVDVVVNCRCERVPGHSVRSCS